jgi:O-antigen ligase
MADGAMVNGIVMGKVVWFHRAMAVLGICLVLFSVANYKRRFIFQWADLLVLIFAGIVCLTYDWELNPEPDKLLFGGQLAVLWFVLRILLQQEKMLYRVLFAGILITGLVEAAWGIMQLYGYKMSAHSLFRLTGSFYNPGPYSGYLATILPLSLGLLFESEQKRRISNTETRRRRLFDLVYFFAWICMAAILIVLPAGMSRSAWIAAAAGCVWVYGWKRTVREKVKELWLKHRKLFFAGGTVAVLAALIAFAGIYSLKRDSAEGRLLMWKITAQATGKQPLSGTGLGGFPAAFAETQAEYFASGQGTEREKMVAGCPEYAFNEYLQIALEQGIPGVIVFTGWLTLCLYAGIRNRRFGVTGGIVALAVFAFSSYPLQLPSFWILLLVLSVMAVSRRKEDGTNSRRPNTLLFKPLMKITGITAGIILFACSCFLYSRQKGTEEAYRIWNKARILHDTKACEAAYPLYEELYPRLKHKPEFLFEAGQCLNKMGRYEDSNTLLRRATLLSADPMIHYIIGKNDLMLGDCDRAESRLLHAINMLPERIYPYYLLTGVYTDSTCLNPEKMRIATDSVLYKTPKVMTTAIREMREEVKLR